MTLRPVACSIRCRSSGRSDRDSAAAFARPAQSSAMPTDDPPCRTTTSSSSWIDSNEIARLLSSGAMVLEPTMRSDPVHLRPPGAYTGNASTIASSSGVWLDDATVNGLSASVITFSMPPDTCFGSGSRGSGAAAGAVVPPCPAWSAAQSAIERTATDADTVMPCSSRATRSG